MGKAFAILSLCLGLAFAQAAHAEVADSAEGMAPSTDTSRFSLADHPLHVDPPAMVPHEAPQPGLHGLTPPPGMRPADGTVQYIEGPKWTYQPKSQGPVLEVGALGGGMESAPFLAHVGLDWHF